MRVINKNIINDIVIFLQNSVHKKGFQKVLVGLSGGIDSAIVARLGQLAIGNIKALLMPSLSSSQESIKDAIELCNKFNISFEIKPIKKYHANFIDLNPDSNLIDRGNFCARMRMATLYYVSSVENRIVLGTSNKSEIMLGYGTIFGDIACAINPIGRFYKNEVYKIAKLLEIPESIINKAPSADLYEGQNDESEIGYSYDVIDRFLVDLENIHNFNTLDNLENINILDLSKLTQKYGEQITNSLLKKIRNNAFKSHLPLIF